MSAMTLDGKALLKEGWLTLYKGKKTGLFNSKPAPDKEQGRGWAVLYQSSAKPVISFYQDNRKETKVMKKEKIELHVIREVSKVIEHPKHPFAISMKCKGHKRLLLHCDKEADVNAWLKVICELLGVEYKREKVIWEYYDGGLWNALPDGDSFRIEAHYSESDNSFYLGESQMAFHYNLQNLTRSHPRTKVSHRIKRTVFTEDRPEITHSKMMDLPAFWEWGNVEKDLWHPFERDTNIQIEDMYDSGSQWAELTLCLPSPMPFLLDLHDMKLVNFRTAARYGLRRIDNSANMTAVNTCPEPRSPSPDEFEDDAPPQPSLMSPMSPLFKPIQDCLTHLQLSRKNLNHKQLIGEGAFGEVFLADATGLPGHEGETMEVAVKQLRLSDFIARHGHHSQQMEDFLREAKEMSKVDHPRVVRLIAVCTLDYPLLLVEEYMNQGDLLGVLKDSRPSMPLLTQLDIGFQVADAMDYLANGLNCVHRDLAARNILVRDNGNNKNILAKVADFGLSRHLYSEMYKHQGSKPRPLPAKWMALESLMYFIFTTKSDVWSYGVLIWEIMTLGRSPYPGIENRELLEQIEEKGLKLSRPKPCPGPIYEMILECTQHDPEERPTFSQLRAQLEELIRQANEGTLVNDDRDSVVSTSPTLVKSMSSAGKDEGQSSTGEQSTKSTTSDSSPKSGSHDSDKEMQSELSNSSNHQLTISTEGGSPATPTHNSPKASPSRNKSATPPKVSPKPSPKVARKPVRGASGEGSPGSQRKELTNSTGSSPGHRGVVEASHIPVATEHAQNKAASSVPGGMAATNQNFNSQDEDLQERAGPLGHLYYLLDPVNDPVHSASAPRKEKKKPPLPNNLPPMSPHRGSYGSKGSFDSETVTHKNTNGTLSNTVGNS